MSDPQTTLEWAVKAVANKRKVAPDLIPDLEEWLRQTGQDALPDFGNKATIRDQAIFNMAIEAAIQALIR